MSRNALLATDGAQSTPVQEAAAPGPRLLIQETGEDGFFIYTAVDRSTGAVVLQTRLAAGPAEPGQEIDAPA
jgi:hypothetical protein